MSEPVKVNFEEFHMIHYNLLKEEHPDKDFCMLCFSSKDVNKKTSICEDCGIVQKILDEVRKVE